jgi:hypothetical protein
MIIESGSRETTATEKVVIQLGTRVVKGYLQSPAWNTVAGMLSNAAKSAPETFRVRLLDSDKFEDIPARDAKAIFFVHSFEGDPQHKPLTFHIMAPAVHGLWVRLDFLDGEVIEGIVYNSIRYLVDPGFYVVPTDPGSNNRLIYVLKSSLKDYRVLGMRSI